MLGLIVLGAFLAPTQAAAARAGSLDRSFGQRGKLIAPLGEGLGWYSAGAQIAEGPDGELLVLRQANAPRGQTLVRYLPNGRLDRSFGSGGFSKVEVSGFDLSVSDLDVDSQGRLVLFGTATDHGAIVANPGIIIGPLYRSFATVVRYRQDGAFDRSFGDGDGVVMTDFNLPAAPGATAPATSGGTGAIAPGDRPVVVAGDHATWACSATTAGYESVDRLIARLTSGGEPDPSFGGGDGIVPLDSINRVSDIALVGGKVALAADRHDPCDEDRNFTLIHLQRNGALDASFGGRRRYRLSSPGRLAIDRFGRAYVQALGVVRYGSGRTYMTGRGIVRLTADGDLDRSFGHKGIATVNVSAALTGDRLVAFQSKVALAAVDPAGRPLLTGTLTFRPKDRGPARERLRRRFLVARLDASGRLNRSFGHRGWVVTGFGRFSSASERDALLDRRGRLVVAGVVNRPDLDPTGGIALVRYLLAPERNPTGGP
jgi:uncharacterized delta-60 repeat protein